MIRVTDKYGIDFDSDNYILVNIGVRGEKSKKKGEEFQRTVGYYTSLESVLEAIVRRTEKDYLSKEDMGLVDAINIVRRVHEEMAAMFREAFDTDFKIWEEATRDFEPKVQP